MLYITIQAGIFLAFVLLAFYQRRHNLRFFERLPIEREAFAESLREKSEIFEEIENKLLRTVRSSGDVLSTQAKDNSVALRDLTKSLIAELCDTQMRLRNQMIEAYSKIPEPPPFSDAFFGELSSSVDFIDNVIVYEHGNIKCQNPKVHKFHEFVNTPFEYIHGNEIKEKTALGAVVSDENGFIRVVPSGWCQIVVENKDKTVIN